MTIDGGFVADEPQSFLLTTAAGTRVFCGGDTSLSGDGGERELASEELRLLIHAILDHQENEFGDDAAIMLLERRPSRSTALSSR